MTSSATASLALVLLAATATAHEDAGGAKPVHRHGDRPMEVEPIHGHEGIEVAVDLAYESRYFSEGRDALDGDALLTGSIELGWEHLFGGIWYGNSPDQRYDELQLTAGLVHEFGPVESSLAYTHFRFPFDGSHDHEVGVGMVWGGLPLDLELTGDAYYSFDAKGSFWEASLSRSFDLTERLSLSAAGIFGVNQGYVSDGHDGANHFAASLGAEYAINDCWALVAHTTYSWAIDREILRPGDATLRDFLHFGLGVHWSR